MADSTIDCDYDLVITNHYITLSNNEYNKFVFLGVDMLHRDSRIGYPVRCKVREDAS